MPAISADSICQMFIFIKHVNLIARFEESVCVLTDLSWLCGMLVRAAPHTQAPAGRVPPATASTLLPGTGQHSSGSPWGNAAGLQGYL